MQLSIKGAVGNFQYGLNKDGKCDWYVIDRETGEVVDRAENMNGAMKKAEKHHMLSKMTEEEKRELGWIV